MKALVYDSVFGNTENGTSDITVYTPRLLLALQDTSSQRRICWRHHRKLFVNIK